MIRTYSLAFVCLLAVGFVSAVGCGGNKEATYDPSQATEMTEEEKAEMEAYGEGGGMDAETQKQMQEQYGGDYGGN